MEAKCEKCKGSLKDSDYQEGGVCAMCLLVEISEELRLYDIDWSKYVESD